MGTTAEKLTYLNDTKSLLKDNINLTGAGLTNQTPFRQYATDLKTALLNILNNGIDTLYNNFPKTTGTGTNITLNNTLQAPIRSVINGDTFQDGEPTPSSPVEIQSVTGLQKITVCGKNLINSVGYNKGTNASGTITTNVNYLGINDYVKVKPNTTYAITFQDDVSGATLFLSSKDKNGDFIERVNLSNARTFTTGANAYYVFVYLYKNGTTFDTGGYVQLEYGSTATTYEAYNGETYDINLGKNLFDISTADYVYNCTLSNEIYTTNELTSSNRSINFGYNANNNYTIKPNETYYVSADIRLKSGTSKNVNALRFNVSGLTNTTITNPDFTNEFQRYIFSSKNETASDIVSGRLLLQASTTNINNAVLEIKNVMISKSNSSYSPYFTPIKLNKIGDYEDTITGTPYNWVINRKIGSVVLDGTENWGKSSNTSVDRFYLDNSSFNMITRSNGYSNYFSVVTSVVTDVGKIYTNVNQVVINFSSYGTTTKEQFKTWLSTHNTKVVYELSEPTIEPITNTELIEDLNNFYNAKSYNGQTNISVDGDLPMILDVSAIIDE